MSDSCKAHVSDLTDLSPAATAPDHPRPPRRLTAPGAHWAAPGPPPSPIGPPSVNILLITLRPDLVPRHTPLRSHAVAAAARSSHVVAARHGPVHRSSHIILDINWQNPLYFDLGMTMDVHPRSRAEPSPQFMSDKGHMTPSSSPTLSEAPSAPQKSAKRTFDVAFLMAPDDLSTKKKQQQQQQLRLVSSSSLMQRYSPPEMTLAHATNVEELKISRSLNHQRVLPGMNFSGFPTSHTSPLGLLIPSPKNEPKDTIIDITQDEQNLQFAKSAFTKVKNARLDFTGTPNFSASPSSVSSTVSGGVSPDMTYQESLSPPMINNSIRSPVNYLQSKMAYFAAKNLSQINPQYLYNHSKEKADLRLSSPLGPNGFLGNLMNKSPPDTMQKLRPMMYQGEGLPYGGLTVPPYPFPPNLPSIGAPVPPHTLLTAASVTAALLPTSIAALTLPAQNVCAKCKISFRMTSDLVYHMRSHHKGEHVNTDAIRRRREVDKLRCPVCNETFRERHHLTRHMTAHQDKEGDHDDEDDGLELSRRRSIHK